MLDGRDLHRLLLLLMLQGVNPADMVDSLLQLLLHVVGAESGSLGLNVGKFGQFEDPHISQTESRSESIPSFNADLVNN